MALYGQTPDVQLLAAVLAEASSSVVIDVGAERGDFAAAFATPAPAPSTSTRSIPNRKTSLRWKTFRADPRVESSRSPSATRTGASCSTARSGHPTDLRSATDTRCLPARHHEIAHESRGRGGARRCRSDAASPAAERPVAVLELRAPADTSRCGAASGGTIIFRRSKVLESTSRCLTREAHRVTKSSIQNKSEPWEARCVERPRPISRGAAPRTGRAVFEEPLLKGCRSQQSSARRGAWRRHRSRRGSFPG